MKTTDVFKQDFARLKVEHQVGLSACIRSIMPGVPGAEEVLRETNWFLWEKGAELDDLGKFTSWAYRVAYFQTLAYLRKRRKSAFLESDVMGRIVEEQVSLGEKEPEQPSFEMLEHRLNMLRAEDRRLIRFHYKNHGGLQEYARAAGTTLGKVRHALIRVRGSLRMCIEHQLNRRMVEGWYLIPLKQRERIQGLIDGTLPSEGVGRINQLLRENTLLRAFYIQQIRMDERIHRHFHGVQPGRRPGRPDFRDAGSAQSRPPEPVTLIAAHEAC